MVRSCILIVLAGAPATVPVDPAMREHQGYHRSEPLAVIGTLPRVQSPELDPAGDFAEFVLDIPDVVAPAGPLLFVGQLVNVLNTVNDVINGLQIRVLGQFVVADFHEPIGSKYCPISGNSIPNMVHVLGGRDGICAVGNEVGGFSVLISDHGAAPEMRSVGIDMLIMEVKIASGVSGVILHLVRPEVGYHGVVNCWVHIRMVFD